jgi:hypothetical protein
MPFPYIGGINLHMADGNESKRGIVEFIFWWLAFITIGLLLAMVKYPEILFAKKILIAAKGSFGSAIVITLLNRLLQAILKRIG